MQESSAGCFHRLCLPSKGWASSPGTPANSCGDPDCCGAPVKRAGRILGCPRPLAHRQCCWAVLRLPCQGDPSTSGFCCKAWLSQAGNMEPFKLSSEACVFRLKAQCFLKDLPSDEKALTIFTDHRILCSSKSPGESCCLGSTLLVTYIVPGSMLLIEISAL